MTTTFSHEFTSTFKVRDHFRKSIDDGVAPITATLVNEPEKPIQVILVGMVSFQGLLAVPLEGKPEDHFFIDVNLQLNKNWAFRYRNEEFHRGFLPVNEMRVTDTPEVRQKAAEALRVFKIMDEARLTVLQRRVASEDAIADSLAKICDTAIHQSHGGYYNHSNLISETITAGQVDQMIGELQRTKRLIVARDELKNN